MMTHMHKAEYVREQYDCCLIDINIVFELETTINLGLF